ncbi:TIGR02206 family membrane protein [Heliophilum fasciatum]|uniref:Putative integral membrane protein (TIGR02206 family) n=1 Tax=Heliophilum fasciatum TaxID=35700 RepID=A0A4R2S8B8_9FIRM|nr:TIGR02206 family membrane protein [Heliophilum fasciatum]MCW2276879.1 putative integral membrane protein (TIGR02206 family) [Heliophilum fasciatum]TCP68661.1 putative integral membrane protein (TIGR02206 family) [Heliophilum fasciatum]
MPTVTEAKLFVPFSSSHLVVLAVIVALCLLLYWQRALLQQPDVDRIVRTGLISVLLLQEAYTQYTHLAAGTWSAATVLPLHICGIAALLAVVMLFLRSYGIYEVVYFWGMAGAVQALLTPALGYNDYPSVAFFHFFIVHGAIVLACLYATWIDGFVPTIGSIKKTFWVTNAYMVPVAIVNWLVNGNYLFLCTKPMNASIMDVMGPWPWYILSLEAVGLVLFGLCYLPFRLTRRDKSPAVGEQKNWKNKKSL